MVTQPKSPFVEHGRGSVEKLSSVDIVQIGRVGEDGIMSVENAPGTDADTVADADADADADTDTDADVVTIKDETSKEDS